MKLLDFLREWLSLNWASGKLKQIAPYLPSHGRIIDIGSGTGMVTSLLQRQSFSVTPVDVHDRSIDPSLQPVLYDGITLPFPDNSFDCALLLTVLHHTADPASVLREASRVAHQIIIIEDVYTNWIQKHLTFFTDSLFNMEFRGHPHSNRRDVEWRILFSELDLTLTQENTAERSVLLFFRQRAYSLYRNLPPSVLPLPSCTNFPQDV